MSLPAFSKLEHARSLHARALAVADGLPAEDAAALSGWTETGPGGPLKLGVFGLPRVGKHSLVAALRDLPLPPDLALETGPALDDHAPSEALLAWLDTLDFAVLLHPLRRDLSDGEKQALEHLALADVPARVALAQADREVPLTQGGRELESVPARLAANRARLADQLPAPAEPPLVWSARPGWQAEVLGTIWSWSTLRAERAAAAALRRLVLVLERIANRRPDPRGFGEAPAALDALANLLPGGPEDVARLAQAIDELGSNLGLFKPPVPQPPGLPILKALAAEGRAALAGQVPPAAAEDLAHLALWPLLAAFAEARLQPAFQAALPEGARSALLLAADRHDALHLLALLYHDLERVAVWAHMPDDAWLIMGPVPEWPGLESRVRVRPTLTPIEGVSILVPPAAPAPGAVEAAISAADVVVVEGHPRTGRGPLPEGWRAALARRSGPVLDACGQASLLDLPELADLARLPGAPPWFLYDDYDARYGDLWRLVRQGERDLVTAWEAAGLSFAPPFDPRTLGAIAPPPPPLEAA